MASGSRQESAAGEPAGIVVIGGGIVGLATARAILRAGGQKVTVLEAEDRVSVHQTGHNSGVIHSGLYYKPGSLKAELCKKGREALISYCREKGLPHEICGKLVIATDAEEAARLADLKERALANGLLGVRRLSAKEIADYEPNASGVAALHVPQTGIVDFPAVAESYARDVVEMGGSVQTGTRVRKGAVTGKEIILETTRGRVRASYVISACGLMADRVARACGLVPKVRIIPFRGEYYDLVAGKADLVRNLIYPVPDPRYPFLGVHFTRKVGGGVEAGPNAVLAFKRTGYKKTSVSLRDVASAVAAPGFLRFMRQHWATGVNEMRRSFSKRLFVAALKRLVPSLCEADAVPGGCGVRAQAMDSSGCLLDDFSFIESARMLHVVNAPSPAATASLAIGEVIAARAFSNLGVPLRNRF